MAGKIFFSSFFPNQDVCGFGGNARLYAIDYVYGTISDDVVLEGMVANSRYKELGMGVPSEPVYYYDPISKRITVLVQKSDATIDRNDPSLPERPIMVQSWRAK